MIFYSCHAVRNVYILIFSNAIVVVVACTSVCGCPLLVVTYAKNIISHTKV